MYTRRLDYPGIGPEHAWLKDSNRAEYHAVTDAEALEAFQLVSQLEGIIPALETSHAFAYLEVCEAGCRSGDTHIPPANLYRSCARRWQTARRW